MRKFILGLLCGAALTGASTGYAADALQTVRTTLFPISLEIGGKLFLWYASDHAGRRTSTDGCISHISGPPSCTAPRVVNPDKVPPMGFI